MVGPMVQRSNSPTPKGHLMNLVLDALGAEAIKVTLLSGQAPAAAQPFAFYAATGRVA